MAWVALLWTVALGYGVAEWSAPARDRWGRVWNAAVGVPLGLGLTSMLYSVLLWLGVRSPWPQAAIELSAIAALVWLLLRRQPVPASNPAPPSARFTWLIAIAAAAALVMALGAVWTAAEQTPHGDWDAWAIWNLRAKFLAGPGETWRHAASPLLVRSHPDYPLLVSGAVARLWRWSADADPAVPRVLAVLWFACVPVIVGANVALLRSVSAGLLTVLLLAASSAWLAQGPAQYADIPLSAFLVAAIAAAARASLLLCGLLAGCAAWTKNEGIVFALALLVAVTVFQRAQPFWKAWAGAAPGLILVALFKILLAPASEYAGRSPDFSRLGAIFAAFIKEIANQSLGDPLGHPLLLGAALAFALRWAGPADWRAGWNAGVAAIGAQMIAYVGVYLLTPSAVDWQLGTSMDRLVAQVWPSIVMLGMMRLRTPEEAMPAVEAAAAGGRKKQR